MMVDSTHLATEPLLGPHLLGRQLAHRPLGTNSRSKQQSLELHGRIQQLDYTSICGFVDCAVAIDRLSFHRVQQII